MDITDKIIQYESGEMGYEEVVSFFQELIDTGMAWQLQGSYGRTAQSMLDSGECSRPKKSAPEYLSLYQGDSDGDRLCRSMIHKGWKVTANEHPEDQSYVFVQNPDGRTIPARIQGGTLYSLGRPIGTLAVWKFWRYIVTPTELASTDVGPYRSVRNQKVITFRTDDGDYRTFRVITYGAYCACGLTGCEYNGAAILDEDQKAVLCDLIGQQASGFSDVSYRAKEFFTKASDMDWATFRDFVNRHSRSRFTI